MPSHHLADLPVATRFWTRLVGLIGKKDHHDLFLFTPRCAAIHTCGMRTPIDVVFVSDDRTVIAIHPAVRPWRICIGPPSSTATLELPPGHAAHIGMAVGDVVTL
jgi:uncharacterized membrane protein (UPF0127 family)